MKVNVLGTEYTIVTEVKREDDENLTDNDGYIDFQTKQIVIEEMIEEVGMTKDIKSYEKHVIRHELVHAFLYESGLTDYANDERIVDWLAVQFPKMGKIFNEIEV